LAKSSSLDDPRRKKKRSRIMGVGEEGHISDGKKGGNGGETTWQGEGGGPFQQQHRKGPGKGG